MILCQINGVIPGLNTCSDEGAVDFIYSDYSEKFIKLRELEVVADGYTSVMIMPQYLLIRHSI